MAFCETVTPSLLSAAACRTVLPGPRGEMAPLALMTRCQGTVPSLNLWVGSEGRCLRQTPTWRGHSAVGLV
jgi:hypothetical protein